MPRAEILWALALGAVTAACAGPSLAVVHQGPPDALRGQWTWAARPLDFSAVAVNGVPRAEFVAQDNARRQSVGNRPEAEAYVQDLAAAMSDAFVERLASAGSPFQVTPAMAPGAGDLRATVADIQEGLEWSPDRTLQTLHVEAHATVSLFNPSGQEVDVVNVSASAGDVSEPARAVGARLAEQVLGYLATRVVP
jgi:hypothetical protein